MPKEVIIYQAKTGAIEFKGDFKHETIWATQAQIGDIFDIDRSVATKHIGKILESREVDEKSNVQKMHIANSDKPVAFYSLDIILAVGYRANSGRAIEFRKWATKVLRQHITKGYTINPKIIRRNYAEFIKAVESVKSLLPDRLKDDTGSILELIKVFSDTWVSLSAYDQEKFSAGKTTKKKVALAGQDLEAGIAEFKKELQKQGEASEFFAVEKNRGSVEGIVGNVMQSFGGKELYPSVESKAAHLLYFMVKNHPFTDGNKRSGAFAFVWFLKRAGRLDTARLNPAALTALTLLIAESQPKEKEKLTGLVAMLLGK